MKRTKFILLALVAAMVLMGAGYAAWTQAFTISSTVETGELFVKVSESHTVDVNDGTGTYTIAGNDYLDLTNIVQSSSADNAAGDKSTLSTLSYDLGKVYPGTRITSILTFENLGTMRSKTKYNAGGSTISGDSELWADLIVTVNGDPVIVNSNEALQNIADAIVQEVGLLEPNAAKTVTIVQELPLTSGNETEQLDLAWTAALAFEQYNSAN